MTISAKDISHFVITNVRRVCDFFYLGAWFVNKMAALAKPKVPIMSTAGAIPFRNEKGQFNSLYRLCFNIVCVFFSNLDQSERNAPCS